MADELSLETILPKEAADLSEAEVAHLNEHASQLTDEQMEKFDSVLKREKNEEGKEIDESGNPEK